MRIIVLPRDGNTRELRVADADGTPLDTIELKDDEQAELAVDSVVDIVNDGSDAEIKSAIVGSTPVIEESRVVSE